MPAAARVALQPGVLELAAVVGAAHAAAGPRGRVVDHHVAAAGEADDHHEVAVAGADRGTAERPAPEGDRGDDRDPGLDHLLDPAQGREPGHERVPGPPRGVGGVERPVAGAVVAVVEGHPRRVVDRPVDVRLPHPGVRRGGREPAVVGEHHRGGGRGAPGLAAAAVLRVLAGVHHLGEPRARRARSPRATPGRRGGDPVDVRQVRDDRADGADQRGQGGAGPAQQPDPQLPGAEAAVRRDPGVGADPGEVVGLRAQAGAPERRVAARPAAQGVPAAAGAALADAADVDLHQGALGGASPSTTAPAR